MSIKKLAIGTFALAAVIGGISGIALTNASVARAATPAPVVTSQVISTQDSQDNENGNEQNDPADLADANLTPVEVAAKEVTETASKKARFDAMTPEQKAQHDAKEAAEGPEANDGNEANEVNGVEPVAPIK